MSSISEKVLGASLIVMGLIGVGGCSANKVDLAPLERLIAAQQERIESLETSRADMQRVIDLKIQSLNDNKRR